MDYDSGAEVTRQFYASVQNKFHFAVHGQTAAEVLLSPEDHEQPNMGLTRWKDAPDRPIRKADVAVAKNYLTQDELTELNRIVTMYLDFAEDQARRGQPMTMVKWVQRLDAFLAYNDRSVLTDVGRLSSRLAEERARRSSCGSVRRRSRPRPEQPLKVQPGSPISLDRFRSSRRVSRRRSLTAAGRYLKTVPRAEPRGSTPQAPEKGSKWP